ncbi:MAG: Twin-arginine translocation protein TatB [uncultured Lysobacter sp.]|uniref:Sec-independent protein translocase protein TatB n=1 Tax=uncultured Lysobacter sp. TaxID=271060 RepID=A0A6J4LDC3_9GAMM|nr:MAG: Twin-arginine translocation protein TatB [uncultured Lysobacter sp.]
MFDIGFSELFVIAVVALIVLGPERLPRAARFAGLWVRRARAQWYSVRSELENELAAEELRRSLRQTQDELRDAHEALQRSGTDLRDGFNMQSLHDTVERSARAAVQSGDIDPPAVANPPASRETHAPVIPPANTDER